MPDDNRPKSTKKIMLALQGGGAHSAYVWGVVDRLLQNDDIEITAISGTSGGAMIATILAYGLSLKRDAANNPLDDDARRNLTRKLLKKFWTNVAAIGDMSGNPYRFVSNPFHHSWNIDGLPVPIALNALSLVTSPYQRLFGLRQNPVSFAVSDCVDFDMLNRSKTGPALYICATNVRTNQPKFFTKSEIAVDHLLASACLPVVDRAVQIDDGEDTEYYWDGGYVADPALSPLIKRHKLETRDLVIVGVNPIVMEKDALPPHTAWEIIDRMNEITFNASLIGEIQRIHDINTLLRELAPHPAAKKASSLLSGKDEILIHYIPPHAEMAGFGVASKSNTALTFLKHLRGLGRDVAAAWEDGSIEGGGARQLGISSDTNLESLFIEPHRPEAKTLPKAVQGARTAHGTAQMKEPALSR
ncbi:patatin-like phospholipase family protein [Herbaspirillum sp. HC18]|nr:patatin-like phospholipase family protein [Herbaspirillum sp. HC18]